MSFLKVFSKILKVGGAVAPAAITAVNPAAGAVMSVVVSAVLRAEENGGSGADKKQEVLAQVTPIVAPMISSIMEAAGSKVAVNPEGVTVAIGQITDGVVALLNALKVPAAASEGAAAGKPS